MLSVWNIKRVSIGWLCGRMICEVYDRDLILHSLHTWNMGAWGYTECEIGWKIYPRRTFLVSFIIDSCFLLIWKSGSVDLYRRCWVSTANFYVFTTVFCAPNRPSKILEVQGIHPQVHISDTSKWPIIRSSCFHLFPVLISNFSNCAAGSYWVLNVLKTLVTHIAGPGLAEVKLPLKLFMILWPNSASQYFTWLSSKKTFSYAIWLCLMLTL